MNNNIGAWTTITVDDEYIGAYLDRGELGVEAYDGADTPIDVFSNTAAAGKAISDGWDWKCWSNGGASTSSEQPGIEPEPPQSEGQPQSDGGENLTFVDAACSGSKHSTTAFRWAPFQPRTGCFQLSCRKNNGYGASTAGEKPYPMLADVLGYTKQHGWKSFPARLKTRKSVAGYRSRICPRRRELGHDQRSRTAAAQFPQRKWRHKCGVGVPTGWVNRIFDIQVDTMEGHGVDGPASLRRWRRIRQVADTLMAESPSGSVHRIYKHPGNGIEVISHNLPGYPGIDIKGDGGMFVAPP